MKKVFGNNLKRLRLEQGYTQGKLAQISGCDQQQISNYEKGTRWPTHRIIVKLATALGCPEYELFRTLPLQHEKDFMIKILSLEKEIEKLKPQK